MTEVKNAVAPKKWLGKNLITQWFGKRRTGAQRRKLGNSGLEVAPLVLGGDVFGWTAGESQSLLLLDAFVESGFNFIDTADVYYRFVPVTRAANPKRFWASG